MKELTTYLPILLPLIIAQFILMIVALVHILKHDQYRVGSRVIWIVVVILFQTIGPIIYFIIGRGEDK